MQAMRASSSCLAFLLAALPAQQEGSRPAPLTAAERSRFTATSTHQEVLDFLAAIHSPRVVVKTFGRSGQGKPLPVAIVADPPCDPEGLALDPRLRVLINANIHGGEVEGKEAALMLVRECAEGRHADLLEHCLLLVVPDFNADGNDRIDKKNRVAQNGPDAGVGRRENAAGLDLNRDFVKLETEEARALVALMNRFEPHALLDLHTTNGSFHGYHVTYATSLSPNVAPGIASFATQKWIPELRSALEKKHAIRAFDYGNFENDKDGPVWASFEPHPRYLSNYFGLRNGLSLLCEAYSYLPFERRVSVTRAFVLEALQVLAARRDEVRQLVHAAERPSLGHGREPGRPSLGFASELGPATTEPVLRGEAVRVATDAGNRIVATDTFAAETMRVRRSFVAKDSIELPALWAIVGATDATRDSLLAHGLIVQVLESDAEADAEVFVPAAIKKQRSFQKHTPVALTGAWRDANITLPKGSLLVPASPMWQTKAMLAAQLLEPQSEDSLVTWNHFDAATKVGPLGPTLDRDHLPFPVLRLAGPPAGPTRELVDAQPLAGSSFVTAPATACMQMVTLKLVCDHAGAGAGEPDAAARQIHYEVGAKKLSDLPALGLELQRLAAGLASPRVDVREQKPLPYAVQIEPFPRLLPQEVSAAMQLVRGLGLAVAPIRWR
jgi:hypothetical protein